MVRDEAGAYSKSQGWLLRRAFDLRYDLTYILKFKKKERPAYTNELSAKVPWKSQ